ncbi:hypothetical protein HDU92_003261 [Lobulomyces angularis]|nr:hypothetical protein HDU92_003261 [Lobulomyces angularis]
MNLELENFGSVLKDCTIALKIDPNNIKGGEQRVHLDQDDLNTRVILLQNFKNLKKRLKSSWKVMFENTAPFDIENICKIENLVDVETLMLKVLTNIDGQNHFKTIDHNCSSAPTDLDKRAIVWVSNHISLNCPPEAGTTSQVKAYSNGCAFQNCKTKSLVPIICQTCQSMYKNIMSV